MTNSAVGSSDWSNKVAPLIAGLTYIPDFIDASQESELLQWIDAQTWLTDLKRRVQHYGYRYDYKARSISKDLRLGELPAPLQHYAKRLQQDAYFQQPIDQIIVNEYEPGQGISAHTDCIPCFGPTVASLSLHSSCIMSFTGPEDQQRELLLEPRSLLILSDEARYRWRHSIAARKSDRWNGHVLKRDRRVSLTFRSVLSTN